MYYSRSKRYPRLPARRQDLRLTAEQTTTKSGCWLRVTAGAGMGRIRLSAAGSTSCLRFLRRKLLPVVYLLHSKAEELGVEVDLAPGPDFSRQLPQHPDSRLILPLLPSCASAGRPA
ncbi:hypothetical protein T08_2836 [Trichinella sp. T8]|nr:hypothetical protein T08_2836 [Trichinella sp. T8]